MTPLRRLQIKSESPKTSRKLIMQMSVEDVDTLRDTGFTSLIKEQARGRYRTLTSEANLQKALKLAKSYEMSINAAAKACSVAPLRIRNRLREEGFDYDWKLIKKDDDMMLDRLHYHRWNRCKLEIKPEFFKTISED